MKKILTFIVCFLFTQLPTLRAQNVMVSGAVTGNGLYSTVGAAFTAINAGSQTGASIVVSIIGNTTEASSATLNAGTWTSLSIAPSGGAARSITGNIIGPVIDFNGADNVMIDGLNTGGNSLKIENTNTGTASTIRFINDADVFLIQNVTLLGATNSTVTGVVYISSGLANGNDSITFNACTIDASPAGNPVNCICSAGSSAANDNGNIAVNNCNIANFFNAGAATCGILVQANNSNWTIQGCRFYQGATRTYTTSNTHRAIQITSGNGHVVASNVIGYATSASTGTYTMDGTVATRFIGIDLSVGTTAAASVQGNLITAISLTTTSGAATTTGVLCGISLGGGSANIGTISGNTIGGSSGTNLLTAIPSTTQGAVVGINIGTTGTAAVQNNIIGGLSSSGLTPAVAGTVIGIGVSSAATSVTISGNTIGNTTADNMRAGTSGLTTGSSLASGITLPSTPATSVISNNTIQNFSSYGTGAGGYVRGIWTAAATGSGASYTINGNVIHDLMTNSTLTTITSGQAGAVGINLSTGTNGVANGNTIYNISNIGTGAIQTFVVGITLANATSSTASNNVIYGLSNASTSTTATSPGIAAGILIRSGTTQVTIYNNMISLGNGQTTNTAFVGIIGNHGSTPDPVDRIWNNTINIEGTVAAGSIATFGIHRGDFTATARTQTVDIKNNIITNTRSGGTGQHFAIGNGYNNASSSATGWSTTAANYNVLNASASTVGYWSGALTIAGWRTSSGGDALSYSGILVTYVNSANNLHLNMGTTPTFIESGGTTIATYTTDIDGQNRPGPTGSVNGGAYAYDIGADEFDGVAIDGLAPAITYTALSFTCATSDRIVTATITDLTGVPTTGSLRPRIYFQKNAGPWFSSQGVLTSGSATNGTWDFTIVSATLGGLLAGDVVSYYVIAQDVVTPTPNIGSNPSAGLVATDVNTVTTPPTTPNSYPVSSTLSGIYTVGTTGTYTTLTAAVNAYNNSCLGGPVTFLLTDANYSASETFPISINANPNASSINTLTIMPQNAGTTITGSASAIIKLNGADYVTINGSTTSTVNSSCSPAVAASRDLTISNSSTSSATAVIWISSAGAGAGATHNSILNCNLSAGVDQSTTSTETYDIVSCGATISTFPPPDGLDNNYNVIENNSIERATWGIYLRGGATSSNHGNVIRQNIVGPSAFGSLEIRKGGIIIQHQDSASIIANEVRFVGNQVSQTIGGTDHIGIGVGGADGPSPTTTNVTNATVARNTVHDIVCEKTFSAVGIEISANNATASNNAVYNNMVYGVHTNATSPDQGIGINVTNGNGDKVVYNTIDMVTADRDPGASTTASESDIGVRFQAGATNQTFENNLVYIDEASNTATLKNFAVVAPSAAYTWTANNYNDYSINATNTQNILCGLGTTGALTQVATLAAWQTTFTPNVDLNSITVVPVFMSSTDVHLMPGSNSSLENLGSPLASYTSDFDCAVRSATTPDMGADEACTLADNPVLSASPSSICVGSSTTITITSGNLNESTSWQWYSTTCGGIPVGSGTSVTVSPGSTLDFYVRGEGGCAVNASCSFVTIMVNALPTVTASPSSTTVCSGTMVTLSGSGATTYTWTGPESVIDNTPFAATISGTYSVTGTDANGCTDTATASVNVNPLPVVTASPSATTVCAGTSVTLSGSGAVSYVWSGPESVTDNVAFVPTVNGTYTVTGTDANGCTDTDMTSVTINALPAVMANVVSQTVCSGSSVTLFGSGAVSYNWNGPQSISDNVAFAATASGTYTVTGTDANGCTNTDTSMLVVNALPSVTYSEPVDTVCQTTTPAFALSGESPAGGTWSGPGVSGNMFDALTANVGFNVITYAYTDTTTGCSASAMDSIYVDLCLDVTPGSANTGISVYPNPNTGMFTLSCEGATQNLIIEVMSADGKLIYADEESDVQNYRALIDLTALANGTYFIRVISDDSTSMLKVIKAE